MHNSRNYLFDVVASLTLLLFVDRIYFSIKSALYDIPVAKNTNIKHFVCEQTHLTDHYAQE